MSIDEFNKSIVCHIKPGTKAIYLGYLAKNLPNGKEIDYDKLQCFPEFDGWGIYDENMKTVYLVS